MDLARIDVGLGVKWAIGIICFEAHNGDSLVLVSPIIVCGGKSKSLVKILKNLCSSTFFININP